MTLPGFALPDGFRFVESFLSDEEEAALLQAIAAVEFGTFQMHGVTARRRVAHYGWSYGYDSGRIRPGEPLPGFLEPLRARAATLIEAPPAALAEALLTEYTPGAGIGWHRDAPAFDKIVGVSLGAACVFKLREAPGRPALSLTLPPRSAYVIDGPARTRWQHSIPGVKTLRYSITFRTIRDRFRAGPAPPSAAPEGPA